MTHTTSGHATSGHPISAPQSNRVTPPQHHNATPGWARWIAVLAALASFVAVSAATVATADAQPARDRVAQPTQDRGDELAKLRLACHVDIVGDQRGVLCRWSEAVRDDVRGYELYRIVNGAPRELVAAVPAGERLHAFDPAIAAGDRVIYGVVARNSAGRVIAIGGPVRLGIDR